MRSIGPTPLTLSPDQPGSLATPTWEWLLFPDAESVSLAAAIRLATELRANPTSLTCLATGASTRRTYELLVALAKSEPSLHARARWIKLDEWGGLAMDDPASCETFLRETLLDPLAVPPARYRGWQSRPADAAAECHAMADWLATHGPIDVQVLGLGENGHLGFNEPAAKLHPGPHVATLSRESLSHAMLGGSRGQVGYGLTLGMEDILGSRRILLLVTGVHKAQQLRRLVTGEISPLFPASLLRRHPSVTIYCDAAAASLCPDELRAARPSQPKEPA